ncbi:uncharacterized protein THITE_33314, partial [Thermothielavioides terrestris NRRL 8126]
EEGDIAYLHRADEFSPADYDYLIRPPPKRRMGYIPELATGHPVIIIRRVADQLLVAPISKLGASPDNDYLAPWKRPWHRKKDPEDFRAFEGSERPSNRRPPLSLVPGQALPHPRASWVYVQSAWVVPLSVLGRFTRVAGVLRVDPASLRDLRAHMEARCRAWSDCLRRLGLPPPSTPLPPPTTTAPPPTSKRAASSYAAVAARGALRGNPAAPAPSPPVVNVPVASSGGGRSAGGGSRAVWRAGRPGGRPAK